jgi:DNA-binding NarL/FixJ family response regulator
MPIRTLLIDDSPEFLRALSRLLSSDPRIEIVGHALSAREALNKMQDRQVDLVLMDIAMPGTSGLEATRWIKAQAGAPRVVILTLYDSSEYRTEAQAVCADGFVSKVACDSELLPLIYALFAQAPGTVGE